MKINKWRIFSLIQNIKAYYEKGKDVPIDKLVNKTWYERQSNHIKNCCSSIVESINNNHFSYNKFKWFIVHQYMKHGKFSWKDYKSEEVVKSIELFNKKRYEKDKEFLLELSKSVSIKDINKYYEINHSGTNIMYDLVSEGNISPLTYTLLYVEDMEPKYEKNTAQELFDRVVSKTKNKLKEAADG